MEGLIFIYVFANTKWNKLEKELAEICTYVRGNNLIKFQNKINDLIDEEIADAKNNLVDPKYLQENYMKSKFVVHRVDFHIAKTLKLGANIKRDDFTLEHIIPQNSQEGLRKSTPPDTSIDEYSKLIHRIGNMTILSKSSNSSIGDSTPYEKIISYEGGKPQYDGTLIPITKVLIDGNLEVISGKKTAPVKFSNRYDLKKLNLYKDAYWSEDQVKKREKSFFEILSDIYGVNLN